MANSRPDVVILAAGNGLRLASHSPLPKPLVTAGERPLLDRLLLTLLKAELRHVCIVVGHAAEHIRLYPFVANTAMTIDWVYNPSYARPNGLSLLCAEGHVRPPFLLLMADHLVEAATLDRFMQQSCPGDGVLLAVDRRLRKIYDLDDATKVVLRDSQVTEIGKDLDTYNAVDTGMFLCSAAVFEGMRASVANGGESLSAGIRCLARAGRVRAWDIGPGRWIDVDTPAARDEAELLIRQGFFDVSPAPVPRLDALSTQPPGEGYSRPAAPLPPRRIEVVQPSPLLTYAGVSRDPAQE